MGKDLCITQPPSQNILPGGNTGLRLPAPRQAHSPSQYTDIHGHCSNFAVISPPDICARPGRRCPHFVLKWCYAEVLRTAEDLRVNSAEKPLKMVLCPAVWGIGWGGYLCAIGAARPGSRVRRAEPKEPHSKRAWTGRQRPRKSRRT